MVKRVSDLNLLASEYGERAALQFLFMKNREIHGQGSYYESNGLTQQGFYSNYSVKKDRVDELEELGIIVRIHGIDVDENDRDVYRLTEDGKDWILTQLFHFIKDAQKEE